MIETIDRLHGQRSMTERFVKRIMQAKKIEVVNVITIESRLNSYFDESEHFMFVSLQRWHVHNIESPPFSTADVVAVASGLHQSWSSI